MFVTMCILLNGISFLITQIYIHQIYFYLFNAPDVHLILFNVVHEQKH